MSNPLATVERIASIERHPNADRLDIAKVLDFEAIVGRDEFKAGDLVLLVHPDACLPGDRDWCKGALKYCGSNGRVKAARLRDVWSMGLVMPIQTLADEVVRDPAEQSSLAQAMRTRIREQTDLRDFPTGCEVSSILGIHKYEPPLPKDLQAKGGLPYDIPKTDEDSWQNSKRLLEKRWGEPVDVTLKIDGSSLTVYCKFDENGDPQVGICSRSMELKDEPNFTNNWLQVVRTLDLRKKLADYCRAHEVSIALRGEVYGAGIQGSANNPHSKLPLGVKFFEVYLIDERRVAGPEDLHYFQKVCDDIEVDTVPILEYSAKLTPSLIQKYDSVIQSVNADVSESQPFEGVVIKLRGGQSFKVINKHYDFKK